MLRGSTKPRWRALGRPVPAGSHQLSVLPCRGRCWQVAALAPHMLPRELQQPAHIPPPTPQGDEHTYLGYITASLCALTTMQFLCTSSLRVFSLYSPKCTWVGGGGAAHPTSLGVTVSCCQGSGQHRGRTAGLWVWSCQQCLDWETRLRSQGLWVTAESMHVTTPSCEQSHHPASSSSSLVQSTSPR